MSSPLPLCLDPDPVSYEDREELSDQTQRLVTEIFLLVQKFLETLSEMVRLNELKFYLTSSKSLLSRDQKVELNQQATDREVIKYFCSQLKWYAIEEHFEEVLQALNQQRFNRPMNNGIPRLQQVMGNLSGTITTYIMHPKRTMTRLNSITVFRIDREYRTEDNNYWQLMYTQVQKRKMTNFVRFSDLRDPVTFNESTAEKGYCMQQSELVPGLEAKLPQENDVSEESD